MSAVVLVIIRIVAVGLLVSMVHAMAILWRPWIVGIWICVSVLARGVIFTCARDPAIGISSFPPAMAVRLMLVTVSPLRAVVWLSRVTIVKMDASP
jgi:hypothetical protein